MQVQNLTERSQGFIRGTRQSLLLSSMLMTSSIVEIHAFQGFQPTRYISIYRFRDVSNSVFTILTRM